MKILILTNMYPTSGHKYFGTFVKKMTDILLEELPSTTCKIVSKSKSQSFFSNYYSYLKFILNGLFQILTFKPTYVFIHFSSISSIPFLIYNLFLNKKFKVITHCHGTDVYGSSFNKYLSQKAFETSDYVLAPSEHVKKYLLKEFSITCPVYVTYSGGVEQPSKEPKTIINKIEELKLGYVSTINEKKGFYLLIEALQSINLNQKVNLKIAGHIEDYEKYSQHINKFDSNVQIEYFGLLKREELHKIYASIDVFIFPTTLPESLGLVGIEAMSYGRPIIASRIGAIPEYLSDNVDGFLFSPRNINELQTAILAFSSMSPEEYLEMSKNAKEKSLNFDSQKYRKVLKKIFI